MFRGEEDAGLSGSPTMSFRGARSFGSSIGLGIRWSELQELGDGAEIVEWVGEVVELLELAKTVVVAGDVERDGKDWLVFLCRCSPC